MIGEKRGKFEIIFDLLKTLQEKDECNKTEAMRGAKLDWRAIDKYNSFLQERNIIQKKEKEKSEKIKLTKKGERLLKELKKVSEELSSDTEEINF